MRNARAQQLGRSESVALALLLLRLALADEPGRFERCAGIGRQASFNLGTGRRTRAPRLGEDVFASRVQHLEHLTELLLFPESGNDAQCKH